MFHTNNKKTFRDKVLPPASSGVPMPQVKPAKPAKQQNKPQAPAPNL